MHLQQTTLFGVRGERIRIKKTSPIVKIAVGELMDFHSLIGGEVTSTGHTVTEVWPRPNNFGCDVARISGRSGCVAVAALTRTPEGTLNAQLSTLNSQRGEASGCGTLILLALAAAWLAAAWLAGRSGGGIEVRWLAEYPDPVCERCGKVLDGESMECNEEGNQ